MQYSLLVVALIVFIFWVLIMGLYLVTTRKQVSIEHSIEEIERDLEERVSG